MDVIIMMMISRVSTHVPWVGASEKGRNERLLDSKLIERKREEEKRKDAGQGRYKEDLLFIR